MAFFGKIVVPMIIRTLPKDRPMPCATIQPFWRPILANDRFAPAISGWYVHYGKIFALYDIGLSVV